MSRLAAALTLGASLTLAAACDRAPETPTAPDAPAAAPAPSTPDDPDLGERPDLGALALTGTATAVSNTAMSITGDATFAGATIHFEEGIELVTAPERISLTTAAYDGTGQTWAQLLQAPEDAQVEIRRVVSQSVSDRARNDGLCGSAEAPAETGYVALIHEGEDLMMAAFMAGEAPGPSAPETALCGTYRYAFED